MTRPRIDTYDLNDLADILITYFDGYDVRDLDELVKQVKVRLALIASGEGCTERSPVCA